MDKTAAQVATEQQILDTPLDFTEEAVLQSFAKSAAHRFARCARHGLYAYNPAHLDGDCPYGGCTSQVAAIADVAAFAEQHGVTTS